MTSEMLGQAIGTLLFAAACYQFFYFLPKKIKSLQNSTDLNDREKLEKFKRRLAAGKRGYGMYIVLIMCIASVFDLMIKLISK